MTRRALTPTPFVFAILAAIRSLAEVGLGLYLPDVAGVLDTEGVTVCVDMFV